MFRFYSKAEVDDRIQEYMEKGYTYQQALAQVRFDESQDVEEYNEYLDSRRQPAYFDDE